MHQSSYKITPALLKRIPYSKIVYPQSFLDRVKYMFWRTVIPFYPYIRDMLMVLSVIFHAGRQPFLLGYIAPNVNMEDFIHELIKIGYGNHFIAWRDSNELIGLRITDGFEHQYHLRVFANGAVHGHYEYTPEAYPFRHFFEIGFENRSDFFLSQFGDLLVPATTEALFTTTARYYMYWQPPSRAGKRELAKRLKTASVA